MLLGQDLILGFWGAKEDMWSLQRVEALLSHLRLNLSPARQLLGALCTWANSPLRLPKSSVPLALYLRATCLGSSFPLSPEPLGPTVSLPRPWSRTASSLQVTWSCRVWGLPHQGLTQN